jgi:hypothetical protein
LLRKSKIGETRAGRAEKLVPRAPAMAAAAAAATAAARPRHHERLAAITSQLQQHRPLQSTPAAAAKNKGLKCAAARAGALLTPHAPPHPAAASAALPVSSLINLPLSRALTVLLLLDALRCHTAAHHPASAPARAASLIQSDQSVPAVRSHRSDRPGSSSPLTSRASRARRTGTRRARRTATTASLPSG